ncbi:MAG TPA: chemotaxis protein CheB [Pirellulaceae bacterium]|nr:chemotaxis protein CheB [Pirellulaceae bacterium]
MFNDRDLSEVASSVNRIELERAPKFVAGIGASAGGLESLESLFRNIPTNSGIAFVVVQHLSPDFKSMMGELLARDTSMKIRVAEEGDRVEANTIYLMPPKKQMILADGCLHLSEKDTSHGLTLPIDHFLRSLALERGREAIAIILSGSGTDGTRGITEIARHGGLVIVESLDTAKFDGMPSGAQATGLVDLVLPPNEIGSALMRFRNHPDSFPRHNRVRPDHAEEHKGMDAIVQLFRNVYDIDFASYRDNTVLRRTRRRMAMTNCETFDEYAGRLKADPEELHALYCDLLIGVTQFFRDPDVFDYLIQRALPELLQRRAQDNSGIRGWVAGCATGEEAYSLAIAFQEAMRTTGIRLPVKLFATDVHKRSIEQASRGLFDVDIRKDVASEYLQRYFSERGNGYLISPEIRRTIVFSPHNILRDAPFTELDFVSCRNLLIYFQPQAQRRAVSLFHYGLRVGGILLLGSSESPGELSGEFEVLEDRYRVYRKNRDVRLASNLRSPLTSADSLPLRVAMAQTPLQGKSSSPSPVIEQMLDQLLPPSILVDSNRTVINTIAGAEKLLSFPLHRPSLDLLELVHSDLRTTLAGAIGRAAKSNKVVRFGNVQIRKEENAVGFFNLTVQPIQNASGEQFFVVSFEPHAQEEESSDAGPRFEPAPSELNSSREQIKQLESDLRYSRENLQAMIEELETSNEELQATNEELIASNEELQSTNEELHSLNEELYSVNAEHQRKIQELAEVNRDMSHLLENTDVATIFLDEELRIRRFTSRVRNIFDLIDADIGRPILAFSSKLKTDDLETQLRKVLDTGEAVEREIVAGEGICYLMRMLPYRTKENVDGVVLMWVDVSSLEALRGRLRWMSAIVESTSDAVIGQDLSGTITSWNWGAEQLYGYTAAEALGKSIEMLVPNDLRHEVVQYRSSVQRGDSVSSVDTVRLHKDGTKINVSLAVSPILDAQGRVIGMSKIARDIRRRIEMEQQIRRQVKQRERFLAVLSHELRNPLNAMSTASVLLLDDRAETEAKASAVHTIQRQVRIMNHLLRDLLDVARISENRINLKFERFDLREIIPGVRELLQSELERHNSSLEFELPDEPVWVNGDRTRLMQVHVNLIHNAVKYSESTEPIHVVMKAHAEQIEVVVIDHGSGIEPENLEMIFEPFTQLSQARHKSDGGLGVGLALARTLIQLHGGQVFAESDGQGHGSIFHVWLPRLTADKDLAACEHSPHVSSSAETPAMHVGDRNQNARRTPTEREPQRICVVEDVRSSRDMLKMLLELEGHQVSTAGTGAEAIYLLLAEKPDLAIIDIGLPDISGYEVARRVRESEDGRSIRLVALTGYGQPNDVEEALRAGFDDHIVKPILPEQIQSLALWTQSDGER